MSSPNHPTSNIEDVISSNFLDFIPASPDYVLISPGKTYSSSSNLFGIVLIASPSVSLFHNDPCMKVLQAFYAKESPIPPPNPITLPVILTPSLDCFRDELNNVVKEEDRGCICFLGCNNSSGTKKYQGSNSGDGGNTRDGVKITGGVIGFGGGIGDAVARRTSMAGKTKVVIVKFKLSLKKGELDRVNPSCEKGKSKRTSYPPKPVPNSKQRLHFLHMDLCGPMRIASINGKWYVLVIVDDYSRYMWVHFLRTKDEAPEQNGVVERRNHTLVEATRTMLIFSRTPLFLWAGELDLPFESMYDDYIGGQLSTTQAPPVHQTPTASTTIADNAPTPTILSSQATNIPNTSQDIDELETQQQHVLQQAPLQPKIVVDNVPNAMFDGDVFENLFAPPSIREPSSPVLIRNQLQIDGDMYMYVLTMSTMEPKNVKEAMTDPAWIESMQEDLLQFKRLDAKSPTNAEPGPSSLTLGVSFVYEAYKNIDANGFELRNYVPLSRLVMLCRMVGGVRELDGFDHEVLIAETFHEQTDDELTNKENEFILVSGIANQNGKGNVVAAWAEVRPRRRDAAYLQTHMLTAQKEEAGIQIQPQEFDLIAIIGNLDEIEVVNANYILMANLQQALTSNTQTNKASIYDSDGSAEGLHYKEDSEEDPEEEPEEDVDIELKDDAELIFPYEVEGEKTPPPRDVSSDSVSSESESEDEEVDVTPEATAGTITQNPYAIRDFQRGLFEVGESSSARDSSNVDGLALWALRSDLEAAVSKPPSDDEDTERPRKKSKNSTSDGTRGPSEPRGPPSGKPRSISEARMREIIRDQVTTSMAEFVANMNHEASGARAGGAGAGGAGADDVDIELEDDAELIFPYEVEGEKTMPPRDVSSDLVSSESESEDEEVDVTPEATAGTITQNPYAIRDFQWGLFKVGESSSARDSSNVDGL
nr:hypothetical protein [Tanacetum cinerariifolium]